MERVEALQSATHNFLIVHAFLRPAFQHAIDPDALVTLKFVVIEIGIVNHFSDLADDLVLDPEPFYQRFECAVVTLMRELTVEHVERNSATIRENFFSKDKLRVGIDEFAN